MSKFHVGDRVRVAPDAEISHGLEVEPGDVGVVTEYIGVPSGLSYPYQVQFDNGEQEVFSERELRPADIVALVEGTPPGDDGEYQAGDEVTVYGIDGDFWGTPDPAPELHAMAVARAADVVNHPAHYNRFPVEVINITEQLDFNRGNAVKYLARAGFKEGVDEMQDLQKAAWYVNRAIEKLTKERESNG